MDPLAELYNNITPYTYCAGNPVLFIDPNGLWNQTANGWSTSDPKDIERFCEMLSLEESRYGKASMAQVDKFVHEEYNGSGGKLSDGTVLLSTVTAHANGHGQYNVSDYEMGRLAGEVYGYSTYMQNQNNFVNPFSVYSYKYYRERSWAANGGQAPVISLAGYAADKASHFLSNSKTWFDLSKMKSFKQGYFGNQYELSSVVSKNKGIAKGASATLNLLGKVATLYDLYNIETQYRAGMLTTTGATYLGGSSAAGFAKNPIGSAWSLGTTLGQWITDNDWYFNAVHGGESW